MSFVSFTALEPRTLLSGTHEEPHPTPHPLPTGNLDADRMAIMTDVAKMKSDYVAAMATLTAARQVRQSHVAANELTLKSLKSETAKDETSVKSFNKSREDGNKALRAKWAPVISADELDVRNNSEGETEQERVADNTKLATDRAAAYAEYNAAQSSASEARSSLDNEVKADRAAVEAARKVAAEQLKTDATAVSVAERAMRSVFQSDRTILEGAIKTYRSHGGNLDALKLDLPKTEASSHK